VKGVITDKGGGEPLIAAAVAVKGTATGTITDDNGEYVLPLKAGTYTIVVTYIGYTTIEETVTVGDDQTVEMSAGLALEAIMGEEVVITMQARGQLAAVNQQLRSNQIVNVVSEERIKELPDQNAAQAVSRLPGVHLDGSRIVVRGIQPKMNKIMINGVVMPSTEANNRASSIGMVSANMLSGIEVYKTLTPDMDADAIGGVVNLKLREAPIGFKANVMAQGTYNAQERFMGNYKFWGDVSNRFFDDKFGASLSMNYDRSQWGNDELDVDYYAEIDVGVGAAQYFLNGFDASDNFNTSQSVGGTLILDYKLPNGKVILSNMINHSAPDETEFIDRHDLERNRREYNLERSRHTTLLLNNSLRLEQQIGILKLDASASYISINREDEYNYFYRFRAENDTYDPALFNLTLLETMEPYEVYDYVTPGYEDNLQHSTFVWKPEIYSENQFIADIDLELPLRISNQISATLKAGGKYRKMERSYDLSSARYGDDVSPGPVQAPMADFLASLGHEDPEAELWFNTIADPDFSTRGDYLNSDGRYFIPGALNVEYMDKMALELMNYSTLQVVPEQWNQDYWGGEVLSAAYLMADLKLWNRLTIIGGARYESQKNDYVAMEVANRSKLNYVIEDTISRPSTHANLLPHLHLRLRVTDWWDVRFSYNQTLSRPDYNYAVPFVYYDMIGGTGFAGNPTIKPALSKNLDANFTFYSRKLGLVTIGGFMKTIEDVFYPEPTAIGNIPDSLVLERFPVEQSGSLAQGIIDWHINNEHAAYLRGLEMEWQSNLTYLPAPFNGLVFNVNYTHVWSETKYVQHRVLSKFIPTPPFSEKIESDTSYTNRLLHQANDIANVSMGYDYKGFSARFSFRFQGNVIRATGSRVEINSYTDDVYRFDFVAKQRIPIKSANLEVFFNAINFTNVPYSRYSIYPNKGRTTTLTRYSGRRFQLGVRLTL